MTKVRQGPEGIVFIDRPDQGIEDLLDSRFQRIPGLLQWKVPNRGALELALEFAKTVVSGFVEPDVLEARKRICLECPMNVRDTQGNSFCAGCRCGRWQLARLDGSFLPKLGYRGTKCPLGKF